MPGSEEHGMALLCEKIVIRRFYSCMMLENGGREKCFGKECIKLKQQFIFLEQKGWFMFIVTVGAIAFIKYGKR